MKKRITNIRKAVCTMANELKKAGYSLSAAFKKAWKKVKMQMVIRVSGTSFENRQERLQFLSQFKPEDLTVSLEREADNRFDKNAVKVRVHIPAIRKYTVIGYVPAQIAAELAKVIDIGCEVKATLKGIIGGYSYKENYGCLVNITI